MTLTFLIILACLALTILRFLLLKRSKITLSTDLGGTIFNGVVAVYSIQLAFVVVVVWQQYQNTGDRIQIEATKASNFYRGARSFPDSVGRPLRRALSDYIGSVVNDEWPAMAHDSLSSKTRRYYAAIWTALDSVEPVTEVQKIRYAALVGTLNELGEARSLRTSDAGASVPGLLWFILIMGSVITIGFASMLQGTNNKLHLLKVLLFSLLLSFNGLLIYLLDHPYRGQFRIKPTAYERIVQERAARAARNAKDSTRKGRTTPQQVQPVQGQQGQQVQQGQ
jgi:hypothetical protein